jgi:hypothetical protein
MKKLKIFYWIFTILMAAAIGVGAIFDAINDPTAVAYVTRLGYPAYIAPFLGVAKIAGVIVILIPGFLRLKEWAYAGIIFDLTGATYSAIAIGDPASQWMFMFLFFATVFGSYIFHHKILKAKSIDPVLQTA